MESELPDEKMYLLMCEPNKDTTQSAQAHNCSSLKEINSDLPFSDTNPCLSTTFVISPVLISCIAAKCRAFSLKSFFAVSQPSASCCPSLSLKLICHITASETMITVMIILNIFSLLLPQNISCGYSVE